MIVEFRPTRWRDLLRPLCVVRMLALLLCLTFAGTGILMISCLAGWSIFGTYLRLLGVCYVVFGVLMAWSIAEDRRATPRFPRARVRRSPDR